MVPYGVVRVVWYYLVNCETFPQDQATSIAVGEEKVTIFSLLFYSLKRRFEGDLSGAFCFIISVRV